MSQNTEELTQLGEYNDTSDEQIMDLTVLVLDSEHIHLCNNGSRHINLGLKKYSCISKKRIIHFLIINEEISLYSKHTHMLMLQKKGEDDTHSILNACYSIKHYTQIDKYRMCV